MEFSHYSREPFEFDNTRTYDQESRFGGYGKPRGFWLSVDGQSDWKEWCEDNDWNVEGLAVRTVFTVSPDANVKVITNPEELVAFDAEYQIPAEHPVLHHRIDWVKVAERYDGIIIAPYIWSMRLDLDMLWYYGWDCASGCFWNLSMIKPIEVADDTAGQIHGEGRSVGTTA
jgi:hypothetical protein